MTMSRAGRLVSAAIGVSISVAALVVAIRVVTSAAPFELTLPQLVAAAGGIVVRVDRLGAFFLLIVAAVSLVAAVYGFAYTAEYDGRRSHIAFGALFNGFIAGMFLVAAAGNIFTFALAWELMAVTSYFLVLTEHEQEEARRAAIWYAAMTHAGLVALLPMFWLMAPAPDATTFADLRIGAAALSPAMRNTVFVLALFAFGSKAGVVPLHVWLPRAHPAAPSHVSALMSGVMVKLGIYGLIRVTFDLLGGGPTWWGIVILALGSASALVGVLYALMEHDLKRLLAYHTVENIGIILIGVGAGAVLHSFGLNAFAAIAFAGALFHSVNHACFKALLFLGAGAVAQQARTRNMEELGGLIKRMPQTAMFFLIGCASISALPPLNGFASEWLVFQSLLSAVHLPKPEIAMAFPIAVGALALTSGLAAACFVKAFGITFLALPRSSRAADAQESPVSMRAMMGLLAAACVALGLMASAVAPAINTVTASVSGLTTVTWTPQGSRAWLELPGNATRISPIFITVVLAVASLGALLAARWQRAGVRRADTWGCGRISQTPRMEYTASAFAESLRRIFAEFYRPNEDLSVVVHPESEHFVQSITYTSHVTPVIEKAIYDPLTTATRAVATRIRALQAGSAHLYLLYVVIALIVTLAAAWWL